MYETVTPASEGSGLAAALHWPTPSPDTALWSRAGSLQGQTVKHSAASRARQARLESTQGRSEARVPSGLCAGRDLALWMSQSLPFLTVFPSWVQSFWYWGGLRGNLHLF